MLTLGGSSLLRYEVKFEAKYGGCEVAKNPYDYSGVDFFGRMHQQQQSRTAPKEHNDYRTARVNCGMQ
jgi:hypothetical protein